MFQMRLRGLFGGAIGLAGLIYMIGAAGTIESGSVSFLGLTAKMIIGCLAVAIGAAVSGGLE